MEEAQPCMLEITNKQNSRWKHLKRKKFFIKSKDINSHTGDVGKKYVEKTCDRESLACYENSSQKFHGNGDNASVSQRLTVRP